MDTWFVNERTRLPSPPLSGASASVAAGCSTPRCSHFTTTFAARTVCATHAQPPDSIRARPQDKIRAIVRGTKSPEQFQKEFADYKGNEGASAALELALRAALEDEMGKLDDPEDLSDAVGRVISLSIDCAEQKSVGSEVVVKLLEDVLRFQTLQGCEKVFPFIERNLLLAIRPSQLEKRAKLALLRICNTLLRRLSRTQNTSLRGKVHMLLTRSLPLDEKTGVNLSGFFNTSNPTTADEAPDNSTRGVDPDFYAKLWSLQRYFSQPKLLQGGGLDAFVSALESVLAVFSGNKLSTPIGFENDDDGDDEASAYNPKYLTGPRLLKLQLQDPKFRCNLLTQACILFAFVAREITNKRIAKLKPQLDAAGLAKAKKWQKRVEAELANTPPHGEQLLAHIRRIFARERYWSLWKDNNCKKIEIASEDGSGALAEPIKPVRVQYPAREANPRELVSMRRRAKNAPLWMNMGDPILNSLWGISGESNLQDCAEEDRAFRPELKAWLQRAIDDEEDADEDAGPEDFRRFEPKYAFRAVRLMKTADLSLFIKSKGKLDDLTVDKLKAYVCGEPMPETPKNAGKETKANEASSEVNTKNTRGGAASSAGKKRKSEASGAPPAPKRARTDNAKKNPEPKESSQDAPRPKRSRSGGSK